MNEFHAMSHMQASHKVYQVFQNVVAKVKSYSNLFYYIKCEMIESDTKT